MEYLEIIDSSRLYRRDPGTIRACKWSHRVMFPSGYSKTEGKPLTGRLILFRVGKWSRRVVMLPFRFFLAGTTEGATPSPRLPLCETGLGWDFRFVND